MAWRPLRCDHQGQTPRLLQPTFVIPFLYCLLIPARKDSSIPAKWLDPTIGFVRRFFSLSRDSKDGWTHTRVNRSLPSAVTLLCARRAEVPTLTAIAIDCRRN